MGIPRAETITTLSQQWMAIDTLLSELDPVDWDRPTPLPGWSVHDVVAHLIGTESMLAGESAPPDVSPDAAPDAAPLGDESLRALPHVRNDIGLANERWVYALRHLSPAAMRQRFDAIVDRRSASLAALSDEEFDAPAMTPVGPATYGRFMQIRTYDCYLHEQDIRDATGRPGHETGAPAEQAVDEAATALGYIVGKKAAAPEGAVVRFDLSGPVERSFTVGVIEGRARMIGEKEDLPALHPRLLTRLGLSSGLFLRLTGGRTTPEEHQREIAIEGDSGLAQAVLAALAYTI